MLWLNRSLTLGYIAVHKVRKQVVRRQLARYLGHSRLRVSRNLRRMVLIWARQLVENALFLRFQLERRALVLIQALPKILMKSNLLTRLGEIACSDARYVAHRIAIGLLDFGHWTAAVTLAFGRLGRVEV